jgi:hypothetical protein
MDDLARILAHEVRLDFLDRRGNGERAPLDYRFTQPDDPGIGVDLQKQPPRLDQHCLKFGYPKRISGRHG